MAKQRKHQGLRADGKLRKGFKYSGKRNKNGTARIVKVVQKKKMKGGGKCSEEAKKTRLITKNCNKYGSLAYSREVCAKHKYNPKFQQRQQLCTVKSRKYIMDNAKDDVWCFKWKDNECLPRNFTRGEALGPK